MPLNTSIRMLQQGRVITSVAGEYPSSNLLATLGCWTRQTKLWSDQSRALIYSVQ